MENKIEFVIPIDKESIKKGIKTLVLVLSNKRDIISEEIELTQAHQPIKKQLMLTKITINNSIVKIVELNSIEKLNTLDLDTLRFITDMLKEEVSSYFIKSMTDEITGEEKKFAYDVMNIFKYINEQHELDNFSAKKRECG